MAEEKRRELQEAQVARQERPVVLEEQADVDDLPKLALTEFVVKTQFGQQDLQLRQKLELEKLQAIHTHEEEKEDFHVQTILSHIKSITHTNENSKF